METIVNVFEEVQASKRSHKTQLKKLNSLLANSQERAKLIDFLLRGILDQTLIVSKSSANLTRILDFYALLLTTANSWSEIFVKHLCSRLKSSNKAVRQRVCNLLSTFFAISMQEKLEISIEILLELSAGLLVRLQDKIPSVRASAIDALKYLQDPEDPEDRVISELFQLLEREESVSVRNSLVKVISLTEGTKTGIVKRLRDISADVRASVLKRFIEETDIRQFSKSVRIEIINAVILDRDSNVRGLAEELLRKWLNLLQDDVIKFLTYFGANDNENIVLLIASLFAEKACSENETSFHFLRELIPVWNDRKIKSSPVELIWVYARLSYLSKYSSKFTLIQYSEKILPDFGQFIRLCTNEINQRDGMDNNMNLKYYLLLVPFFAHTTDVTGLDSLSSFLVEILKNEEASDLTLDIALKSYWTLLTTTKNETEPISLGRLFNQLNLDDSMDVLTKGNFLAIQWILQNVTYYKEKMVNSFNLVLAGLQSISAELRSLAVSCLGLFCTLDETIRMQYRTIIKQVAFGNFEDPIVRMEALMALFDICIIAGGEFSAEEKLEIDSFLCKLIIQDSNDDIKNIAMEGAVKLIFTGFTKDPAIVSKLLHFFFIGGKILELNQLTGSSKSSRLNPESDKIRTMQMMSVFLQTFIANGDNCMEIVRMSLSLFISDFIINIRDECITVTDLSMVLLNLFGICQRVIDTAQKQPKLDANDKELVQNMIESNYLLRQTAFGCICRELLKLGTDKIDKMISKELSKLLSSLYEESWNERLMTENLQTILTALKDNVDLDKASVKYLDLIVSKLSTGSMTESNLTKPKKSVYELAPGLKDLIQLTQHSWDEPSLMSIKPPRVRQSRVSGNEEDEDDDNESLYGIAEEDETSELDSDDEAIDEDDADINPPSKTHKKNVHDTIHVNKENMTTNAY